MSPRPVRLPQLFVLPPAVLCPREQFTLILVVTLGLGGRPNDFPATMSNSAAAAQSVLRQEGVARRFPNAGLRFHLTLQSPPGSVALDAFVGQQRALLPPSGGRVW